MELACNYSGRNFCAPRGSAALFFDCDGTLMKCDPLYRVARDRFGDLMRLKGFDKKESVAVMEKIERRQTDSTGFDRHQFPKSMVAAYLKLCKLKGVKKSKSIGDMCQYIGNSVFFQPTELFENVKNVLNRARGNFLMFIITMGNREAQEYKITDAGLHPYFDDLLITPFDNKLQIVSEAIEDYGIDPRYSAVVGNSLRSDGPCVKVTNFIYLPFEQGFGTGVELPQSEYKRYDVPTFDAAYESAIQRLYRQRILALASGQGSIKRSGCPHCGSS